MKLKFRVVRCRDTMGGGRVSLEALPNQTNVGEAEMMLSVIGRTHHDTDGSALFENFRDAMRQGINIELEVKTERARIEEPA